MSLILFIVVAVLLGFLSCGLARGDIRNSASAMWVVIVGLGVSSVGFLVAGLTGLPVYNWAAIAAEGSGSVIEMASRSESLATTSQTMLLMFGLGGLLISMSVLGVVAVVRRWTPVWAFVVTVVIAAVLVVVGVIIEGPVFWLALGVLPLLWALAFGLILLIRGRFNPTTIHTHT